MMDHVSLVRTWWKTVKLMPRDLAMMPTKMVEKEEILATISETL